MVADYFEAIGHEPPDEELPPVVRSLQGVLRGAEVDEQDHRRHLEERHL